VTEQKIDLLRRSRRIPAKEIVSYRPSRGEVVPAPEDREVVVCLEHFRCGFGLPASDLMQKFLEASGVGSRCGLTTLGRMPC
jgi:hypothetical protein